MSRLGTCRSVDGPRSVGFGGARVGKPVSGVQAEMRKNRLGGLPTALRTIAEKALGLA